MSTLNNKLLNSNGFSKPMTIWEYKMRNIWPGLKLLVFHGKGGKDSKLSTTKCS